MAAPQIRLYGLLGEFLAYLDKAGDVMVEETIDGILKLSFWLPANRFKTDLIAEDLTIKFDGNRYLITQVDEVREPERRVLVSADGAAVELLTKVKPGQFDVLTLNASDGLHEILRGTGWFVGTVEGDSSLNSLSEVNRTALWLIQSWASVTGLEVEFDTEASTVNLLDRRGTDTEVGFRYAKNLREVHRTSVPPVATRLWAYGRNGLSISSFNPTGLPYVEDFSWYTGQGLTISEARSFYLKEYVLTDDRFLNGVALLDYATRKLAQLSQPVTSYAVTVLDLQTLTGVDETFGIGDTVHVFDSELDIDVDARVVRYRKFRDDPSKNEVELAYLVPGLEALPEDTISADVGLVGDQLVYDENETDVVIGTTAFILDNIALTAFSFTNATGGFNIEGTASGAGVLKCEVMLDSNVLRTFDIPVSSGLNGVGIPFVILNIVEGSSTLVLRCRMSTGTFSVSAFGSQFWVMAKNLAGGAGGGPVDQVLFDEVDTTAMTVLEEVDISIASLGVSPSITEAVTYYNPVSADAASVTIAEFDPANIVGVVEAWVADDIAQADASAVSSWVGRVASSSLDQATGAKQPLYRTSAIGGQPGVDFDGTDDLLVFGSPLPLSASLGHVFAVILLDTVAAGTVWGTFDTATDTHYLAGYVNPDKVQVQQIDGGTLDNVSGNQVLSGSTGYLVEWCSTDTAYELRLNGTLQTLTVNSGANSGDWATETTARDNLAVGAQKRTGETVFLNGKIAVLIIVSGAISSADRENLRGWVSAKYGITVV